MAAAKAALLARLAGTTNNEDILDIFKNTVPEPLRTDKQLWMTVLKAKVNFTVVDGVGHATSTLLLAIMVNSDGDDDAAEFVWPDLFADAEFVAALKEGLLVELVHTGSKDAFMIYGSL